MRFYPSKQMEQLQGGLAEAGPLSKKWPGI